jgi:type IV pilus assembly protein PilQ
MNRDTASTASFSSLMIPALLVALAGGPVPALLAQQGPGVARPGPVRIASAAKSAPAEEAVESADGPKVKVSDQNMVELHVKNEEIASVLQLLGFESKKNIIVTKNVSGKVSADLYSASFYEALDAILHPNGFAYVERGNFIYVYTIEELEKIEKTLKKRVAKKITLNYLNGPDAAEFVKGMLSKEGEIKTTPKIEAFAIGDSAPVGKDDFALAASIVVTDYEENIVAIESLLKELDTKPQQVLIEATVLQTKLTENNAFGVDVSILDDVRFSDFAAVGGGPRAVADAIVNGGPTASSGFVPADNRAIVGGSTPGGTGGKSTFKFGLISSNVGVFVKLLDEVSDTTVLANPKILTLNRQPSRVLVGRRVAYLSTTATETSTTQTVEYLDTGVQLYVRPFVSQTGDIRLEIKPQVSTAEPKEIQAAAGGRVTVPDEVTQQLTTNIIVPDGMTVVIGGLFQESTTVGRSQVPGLGDLPIIGSAFKGNNDALARDEIIFLVTPSIMADKTLIAQGEQAEAMGDRLRAGARQSLLPFSRERMTSQLNLEAEMSARAGKFDEALWKINRSLSMKPNQESALRLRDRILGQREVWPSNIMLDGVVGTKVRDQMNQITPPSPAPEYKTPWNHAPLPRTGFENNNINAHAPVPVTSPQLAGAGIRGLEPDTQAQGEIKPLFQPWENVNVAVQPAPQPYAPVQQPVATAKVEGLYEPGALDLQGLISNKLANGQFKAQGTEAAQPQAGAQTAQGTSGAPAQPVSLQQWAKQWQGLKSEQASAQAAPAINLPAPQTTVQVMGEGVTLVSTGVVEAAKIVHTDASKLASLLPATSVTGSQPAAPAVAPATTVTNVDPASQTNP